MTYDAMKSAMFNLADVAPDLASDLASKLSDAMEATKHDPQTRERFRIMLESVRKFVGMPVPTV